MEGNVKGYFMCKGKLQYLTFTRRWNIHSALCCSSADPRQPAVQQEQASRSESQGSTSGLLLAPPSTYTRVTPIIVSVLQLWNVSTTYHIQKCILLCTGIITSLYHFKIKYTLLLMRQRQDKNWLFKSNLYEICSINEKSKISFCQFELE